MLKMHAKQLLAWSRKLLLASDGSWKLLALLLVPPCLIVMIGVDERDHQAHHVPIRRGQCSIFDAECDLIRSRSGNHLHADNQCPPAGQQSALARPQLRHNNHDVAQRLSYSSWRRHQTPVLLRPLGARSTGYLCIESDSNPLQQHEPAPQINVHSMLREAMPRNRSARS